MPVSNDLLPLREPAPRTIMCPFIPIIKSNHGSNGRSGFLFRSTWKPYALSLLCDCVEDVSASRLLIRRFRAPNMALAVDSCISSRIFFSSGLLAFITFSSSCLLVLLSSSCCPLLRQLVMQVNCNFNLAQSRCKQNKHSLQ